MVITRARILGRLFGYPVYVIEQVACLDLNARLAKERLDQKVRYHLRHLRKRLANDEYNAVDPTCKA